MLAAVLLGLAEVPAFARGWGLRRRVVDLSWVAVAVPLGFFAFAGALAALKYPGADVLLGAWRRLAGVVVRALRRGHS